MTATMPESPASPPRPTKRPRHGHEAAPSLPDEVIVEHILTRVPAAATVCFRAVCRNWRAALTSDHFIRAHQAVRAAAAHQPPEIVFFAPGATAGSTAFYSSRLYNSTTPQNGGSSATELVTVGDLRTTDLVMSGGCHGLTLLFQPGESTYHVINLSTCEHVSLPPCAWAHRAIPYRPYVLSSAGLGFHPAANEHKVVRLFEDWSKQQRCEVYGLRSGGGWRSIAGEVPRHAARGLIGRPPVFADGCFYWHMNTGFNFAGMEEKMFRTPEPILSLSVDTERFGWVCPPEEWARDVFLLAELDGHLCAVVDIRGFNDRQYELWIRTAAGPALQPTWSVRCRVCFGSLPRPTRDAMGRAIRMLPLGSSGGKILLATSRHEVYAYDPENNSVDRVFSMQDFVDAPREPELLLNIAMHEETFTGVRRRPVAGGDVGKLKVKLGRSSVARRGGGSADRQHGHHFNVTQQRAHRMFTLAGLLYSNMNMHQ